MQTNVDALIERSRKTRQLAQDAIEYSRKCSKAQASASASLREASAELKEWATAARSRCQETLLGVRHRVAESERRTARRANDPASP